MDKQDKNQDAINIRDVLDKVARMMGKPFSKYADDYGYETGLEGLDSIIGGLKESCLHILAGRPGMGMTNLSLQMALHLAVNLKAPVGFLDFEASPENLLFRATSSMSGIDLMMIRKGFLLDDDWKKIYNIQKEIMVSPLHFIPPCSSGEADLVLRVDGAIKKHDLKFLVIDDLRSYALSMIKFLKDPCVTPKITYHLKQLCEKFKIPILCTLKLGASADRHKGNMPRLTDINPEYGCVENADVIMFLLRPSFYFVPEDFDDDNGEFDEDFYKSACVKVERHRNGPTGSVTLRYEQNIGRFFNMMEWDVEYV